MEDVYGTEMTDAGAMLEDVMPETTESVETKKPGMIDVDTLTELFQTYGLVSTSEGEDTAEIVQTVDNSEYLQLLHEDLTVTIHLLVFIAGFQTFMFGMAVLVFIYRVIKNNVTRYI